MDLDEATHLPTQSIWIDRAMVSLGEDPFSGKAEIALVSQVHSSEEAAREAVRAMSSAGHDVLVYGFYRGELGIVFPTIISQRTAPRVTQALTKILEQELPDSRPATWKRDTMKMSEVAEQLRTRINNDLHHFEGQMPERYAIAWRAYLSALFEWGVIDMGHHDDLARMVPDVRDDDPVVAIAMGREDPPRSPG